MKDRMIRDFVVQEGVLSLQKSRVLRHSWNAVGWKYPHPVDDAMGDVILLSSSMQSLEQYARQRYGFGAEELIKRVVDGNKKAVLAAVAAAEEVFKATGKQIDWQYFFPLPNRNGINIQIQDQPDSGLATQTQGA